MDLREKIARKICTSEKNWEFYHEQARARYLQLADEIIRML